MHVSETQQQKNKAQYNPLRITTCLFISIQRLIIWMFSTSLEIETAFLKPRVAPGWAMDVKGSIPPNYLLGNKESESFLWGFNQPP